MARVWLLLLTEDSGRDAPATQAALVRAMLRLFAPRHDSREVALEPANDAQRQVMRGNRWDSARKEYEPQRRSLVRSIATRICQDNLHFVLFHYDGDLAWSDRERCPRHEVFERMIVTAVRQLVVATGRTPEQQKRALSRLVTVIPFYSVEAWLYQNTPVAVDLCRRLYGGTHADLFDGWSHNRGELDEVIQPKRATCLEDKHNRELAEGAFPADVVYAAGKSFYETVERLRGCSGLAGVLEALSPREVDLPEEPPTS